MTMFHVEPKLEELHPARCTHCGGLMRLVGSEPHPVRPGTDLLTYVCIHCEQCEVASMAF